MSSLNYSPQLHHASLLAPMKYTRPLPHPRRRLPPCIRIRLRRCFGRTTWVAVPLVDHRRWPDDYTGTATVGHQAGDFERSLRMAAREVGLEPFAHDPANSVSIG